MRTIILILFVASLVADVFFAQAFSTTKNVIHPYKPSTHYASPKLAGFNIYVGLNNGSFFDLGPALLLTYSEKGFKNYTVTIPGVSINGPFLNKSDFIINKKIIIDPCVTDVTWNFAVDFPGIRTDAVESSIYTETATFEWSSITVERYWWDFEGHDCESNKTVCTNYARWHHSSNDTVLYLNAEVESPHLLSETLKSITFRQIGSESCKMGSEVPTKKDYSFTIDYSTSHVHRRNVLLRDLPSNISFAISVTRYRIENSPDINIYLWPPINTAGYQGSTSFNFLATYWVFVVSTALSMLLLLASGTAIFVLKIRQRRALRAQYESIPDEDVNNVYNNYNNNIEEQNIIVSSVNETDK